MKSYIWIPSDLFPEKEEPKPQPKPGEDEEEESFFGKGHGENLFLRR